MVGEINPELLAILACPESKEPLRLATEEELSKIREAQRRGELTRVDGSLVAEQVRIDNALIAERSSRAYRIEGGIPILLIEEAINFAH